MQTTGKLILNPYIYSFSTLDNTYIYLPYKHTLASFSNEEWRKVQLMDVGQKTYDELVAKKIYVEKNYPKHMLNFYRQQNKVPPSLHIMYIISTDSCNFNCKYCFIENNFITEERHVSNIGTIEKWIDYAFSNSEGELRFIFYGGEPLLNKNAVLGAIKHIRKLQLNYKSKKIRISINTNGSVYGENLAQTFKELDVSLSISLDGPKNIHDSGRITKMGHPTFNLVFDNISRYINKDVDVSLSITITKYNVNYLPQIARWVIDTFKGKIKGIGFNPPMESTLGNPLNVEDVRFAMLQMFNAFRIFRKYGIYEDRIMRRLNAVLSERPHLKDCAGVGNQIVVSADGKIGPCQAFIGSGKYFTNEDPRKYKFASDKTISEWNTISPINKKSCYECPFVLLCGNGCPYYAEMKEGSLHGVDKRYCEMLPVMMNEILKDNFYGPVKAVFIDYDDTLISRNPLGKTLEVVGSKLKINYKISYEDFIKNNNSYLDVREFFLANGIPGDKINSTIFEYINEFRKGSKPNNWLISQLAVIKLPKYILTNTNEKFVAQELKNFGLEGVFNGVFGNSIYKKPSKEFYENAFKSTGFSPENVLYIGDSSIDIGHMYDFGCRVALLVPKSEDYDSSLENRWLIDLCQ